MSQGKTIFVAEEVLEVRYEPKGSFLNTAGQIADYVVEEKIFPNWSIENNNNRIKFFNHNANQDKFTAFMSFRNAGCVAIDADTRSYFRDKSLKYWKAISSNKYFAIPKINRMGIRTRCFVKSELEFTQIEQKMFSNFFKDNALRNSKLRRKDLSFTFDLEGADASLRMTIAPVLKGQAYELLPFKSDHFENAGTFFDLDYYSDAQSTTLKSVENFVRVATDNNWEYIDRFLNDIGV